MGTKTSIYLFTLSSFVGGAVALVLFAPAASVLALSFDAQPPIIYYKILKVRSIYKIIKIIVFKKACYPRIIDYIFMYMSIDKNTKRTTTTLAYGCKCTVTTR